MSSQSVSGDPVARLDAAVDELLTGELAALESTSLMDHARRLERIRRRLTAVDQRLVAEMQSRRICGEHGRSSTVDLLVSELRIGPGEARERVQQADDLGPRRSLTGEPLPTLLPASARASAEGEISAAHIRVITDCLEVVPPSWSADQVQSIEETLVEFARHEHPGQLRKTASLLLARLDPDGTEPRDDLIHRRRDLTLTRNRDGSGCLRGRLTAEATAAWDTVLGTLGAPAPTADGARDDRTAGQRRHDALVEAGQRLLRSGDLPAAGGVPMTILVRTTHAELSSGRGIALDARGDRLPLCDVLAAAGDAEIVPITTDSAGAVLALGRTRRLASRAQRLALAARDGGCTFPACERPAAWTEVHHVRPWESGGPTDVDNMCLVCRFHHRSFEAGGWQVQMSDGVPEWIPPPFIDPAQLPRRNSVHHLPEIIFGRAAPSTAA